MTATCATCARRDHTAPIHWLKVDGLWTPFDTADASGPVHRCYRDHYKAIDARRTGARLVLTDATVDPLDAWGAA